MNSSPNSESGGKDCACGWIKTAERRPAPGSLIVKRWLRPGSVWAGVYGGSDKDSSFDEWCALPAACVTEVSRHG
jgi:hypothetical protein